MMIKRLFLVGTVLAAGLAYAGSSYNVNLYRATNISGTAFKAGTCKVQVSGDKATFKQGKASAEAAVKVENGTTKFLSTSVGYKADTNDLQEIRVGGTSTMLVFDEAAPISTRASK